MLLRALLLLLAGVCCTMAQNITGTILGTITDPSGAAIADAAVEITHIETNQATRTRSDGAGFYQTAYLRPGTYRVAVSSSGSNARCGTRSCSPWRTGCGSIFAWRSAMQQPA